MTSRTPRVASPAEAKTLADLGLRQGGPFKHLLPADYWVRGYCAWRISDGNLVCLTRWKHGEYETSIPLTDLTFPQEADHAQ